MKKLSSPETRLRNAIKSDERIGKRKRCAKTTKQKAEAEIRRPIVACCS
jgi:hypothetical protein